MVVAIAPGIERLLGVEQALEARALTGEFQSARQLRVGNFSHQCAGFIGRSVTKALLT